MRAESTGPAHRFLLALALVSLLGFLLPVTPVLAATDRLPDLRAAFISDFHIVTSGGHRLLRFTGKMYNTGAGPLDLRASRPNRSTQWVVKQIVSDSGGGTRAIQTGARMAYAGDGHDHWHVRQMMIYHLWGAGGTLRDAKIGFCFFDTDLVDGDLPRSPTRPVYHESGCARRTALKTLNGISVGWADRYAWNLAFQYIDISGLSGGTYTIRAAVDLPGNFTELSKTNNCAWATIRLAATGKALTVLDRGKSCINDHATSPDADAITWARASGISDGCGFDMFCTDNPMTRDVTATFLSRALRFPPATRDYFTDDAGTSAEPHINRIAEAGITGGCAAHRFCPSGRTSNGIAAAFLARALALPPATQDWFDDDNGTKFEADLNRIAEAGIWAGCGVRRSCPNADATRGRFMAWLFAALGPDPIP